MVLIFNNLPRVTDIRHCLSLKLVLGAWAANSRVPMHHRQKTMFPDRKSFQRGLLVTKL